jgi:hypothetical protein
LPHWASSRFTQYLEPRGPFPGVITLELDGRSHVNVVEAHLFIDRTLEAITARQARHGASAKTEIPRMSQPRTRDIARDPPDIA